LFIIAIWGNPICHDDLASGGVDAGADTSTKHIRHMPTGFILG
jgi:hypothetical protein